MKLRFIHGALVVALGLACATASNGQPPPDGPPKGKSGKPGVSINDAKALKGYTLIAPMTSTKAYLIDMDGRVVHTWECNSTPALSTYLLDNGNLLRPAAMGKGPWQVPAPEGRFRRSAGMVHSCGITSSRGKTRAPITTSRASPTATC